VLLGDLPGEEALLRVLEKLDVLVVFELEVGAAFPGKALVLPSTAFSEKDGTMVNEDGRVQRLRPATELPRGIRTETEILQEVLSDLGGWDRMVSAQGVFRELAPVLGVDGATYREIGNQGVPVNGAVKR
jgi:predicted molibdopterin-dependent oxidoreductase YjgC